MGGPTSRLPRGAWAMKTTPLDAGQRRVEERLCGSSRARRSGHRSWVEAPPGPQRGARGGVASVNRGHAGVSKPALAVPDHDHALERGVVAVGVQLCHHPLHGFAQFAHRDGEGVAAGIDEVPELIPFPQHGSAMSVFHISAQRTGLLMVPWTKSTGMHPGR